MKLSITKTFKIMVMTSLTLFQFGCNSGSSSPTGSLTINVTDAPIDTAEKVIIEFSGIEIKPQNGTSISFDFTEKCTSDPDLCQIDLLALNNGLSQQLLDSEIVSSGQYNWLRLMVNAEANVKDSYIVIAGKEYELHIPSGAQSGLKLNQGFVVPAGGEANFTIDFDLRKSVHDPVGMSGYILRPSLRMMNNVETGTLSGSIDASFYSSGSCNGAVYVFDGSVDTPDDEDGEGYGPDPITSALVNDDGVYNYKVSFLTEGNYLIAFTCDALADNPDLDDDTATVSFLSTATVTINANNNTVYNFEP
ncbi:MAG: DUF4382 domain-containing protein [Gammaproteobacteria bacterium]|nr:DUF4382 domain-containing protein [Gammaproteobacteria bacterium]